MQKRNIIIDYGGKMRGFWVRRLAWVQVICRPLVCAWPQTTFSELQIPHLQHGVPVLPRIVCGHQHSYGSRNALDKRGHTKKMVGVFYSLGLILIRSHMSSHDWGKDLKLMSYFESLPISYPAIMKQLVVKGWQGLGRAGDSSYHPNRPSIPTLLKLVVNEGAWSKPSFPGSDESHSLLKSLSCGL